MFSKKLKTKSLTATTIMNLHGAGTPVIDANDLADAFYLSTLHVGYYSSRLYRKFIGVGNALLAQFQFELESFCAKRLTPEYRVSELENPSLILMDISITGVGKLLEVDPTRKCVPMIVVGEADNRSLFADLIEYEPHYLWLKKYHLSLPMGKEVFAEYVEKMKTKFEGRVEGRQVWHVRKNRI